MMMMMMTKRTTPAHPKSSAAGCRQMCLDEMQQQCSLKCARRLCRPQKGIAEDRVRARQRSTSRFRGVTHHCRTRRWESHIWEASKQVAPGRTRSLQDESTPCQRNLLEHTCYAFAPPR